MSAKVVSHVTGDLLRTLQCPRRHRLWLPAFNIIATDLQVSNRLAKMRFHFAISAARADRQQGNFVLKINKPFDNDPAALNTGAFFGDIPGSFNILRASEYRLSFSRRRHDGLDQTGKTYDGRGLGQ